jgi:hypothetical protein
VAGPGSTRPENTVRQCLAGDNRYLPRLRHIDIDGLTQPRQSFTINDITDQHPPLGTKPSIAR